MDHKERQRNVEWNVYYRMMLGSRIDHIVCTNCGFNAHKKYACCPLCGSHMKNGEVIRNDR